MKDYYQELGVSRDASADQIKSAYRKLARQYHPDKNKGDKTAEERFKAVSNAYAVLSDPERRKAYDQDGMEGVRQTGFQGWTDVDDILAQFGDLFGFGRGGGVRFGRSRRGRGPRRGADSQAKVEVDFATAALGGKLSLRLTGGTPCAQCGGTGMGPGTPCGECGGTGVVERPRSIEVRIPEGTQPGQTLRLKGLGDAGQQGGPAGDLLLQVEVEADSRFRREGDDVISDLRVPVWTALLGGKVVGQTLRGNVEVRVPPETSSDTWLRLKGQGVRGGDHRFRVVVEVPKGLSEAQKELLRKAAGGIKK